MKIGVIGTGTIASAVVEAIAQDGHHFAVSERSPVQSARLADRFNTVQICDNPGVVAASDVIILGLMAEVAPEVLGALEFRTDQQVISLMAGASLDEVQAMVAPAKAEAVMIPFPGIAHGGSPILVRGNTGLVQEIFGRRNTLYPLESDAALSAFLCAQALLLPTVTLVQAASDWLENQVGEKYQADGFLRHLIASSLMNTPPKQLLTALGTQGGYNARLRDHMEAAGMSGELASGLGELAKGD